VIYLATALFTAAEQAFAAALTAEIEALGYEMYSPWRDAGDAALVAAHGEDWPRTNAEIARRNLRAIESCDWVLAVVEGADVDAGVAMEVGYAHALGKPIKLLRTDFRSQGARVGAVNIMLGTAAERLYGSVEALLEDLRAAGAGGAALGVGAFYDLVAGEYSDAERHPTTHACKRAEEAMAAERLAGRRFRAALDLGCGDGNFLCNVAADEKVGVDCSLEMIRRHRGRLPEAAFLLADCQRPLPLAPAAFDLVHCAFVLDHLSDVDGCLREMRRLVAPDGLILLATYSPGSFERRGAGEGNEDVLRYRTAAGRLLSVRRSFRDLAGLGRRLAALFRIEEERTVPVGAGGPSFDYYVLRPSG
jgi:nucleoside 2-deoxyribosyltransferase/SAM-dependent methyltransferase